MSSSKEFWSKGDSSQFENSPSSWSDVFRINDNFIQQLSAMFATWADGKDGELSNQALAGWIERHMTSFSTNQIVQFLYLPLQIIIIMDICLIITSNKFWKLFSKS